jgi:hypothetical protein
MNHMHITVRTTHYGIHLHDKNCDRFLDLSERDIPVKFLTWLPASKAQMSEWISLLSPWVSGCTSVRLLPLHPMANYEYFNSCPCILGNIKLDYHLGFSGDVRNLKIHAAKTLCPSIQLSGMDFHSEFYDGRLGIETCSLHLVVILMVSNRS